jgi:tetratricopeptide (TPR) repeat protein
MANTKVNEKEVLRQENIQETVSKTDQFYNEHKKTIWTVVCILAVIALAIFAYVKLIYQPKCAEASQQAFPAEQIFANGEYELALNGDGNVLGLADIIDQYGAKAGAAVFMEAGVCALQTGDYEAALEYLKKYNGKEPILAARAIACQGDAYVGLEKFSEAAAAYSKAAAKADNVFAAAYLLKAGQTYEKLGDKARALEAYKTIKDKYPQSIEGYDIDKYITRAEAE